MSAARLLALAVALISVIALALQIRINIIDHGNGLLAALWVVGRFFTILTNLWVAIVLGRFALTGRMPGAVLAGAVTSSILLVGIVYHLLLSQHHPALSRDWWPDHGLHSAVPALTFLWWLAFAPKSGLTVRAPVLWLAWPVIYSVYAIGRGLIDGVYPYFFFDIGRFGVARVALNSAGLLVAFFLAGHALRLVAVLLTRNQPRSGSMAESQ